MRIFTTGPSAHLFRISGMSIFPCSHRTVSCTCWSAPFRCNNPGTKLFAARNLWLRCL